MFFGGHSSNPGASGEVRGPVPHSAGGAKPLQWTNGVGLDEEVSICRTLQLSVSKAIFTSPHDQKCSFLFSIKKLIESGIRDKIWYKHKLTNKQVYSLIQ